MFDLHFRDGLSFTEGRSFIEEMFRRHHDEGLTPNEPPPRPDAGLERDLARLLSGRRVSSSVADRVAYARDLWPRHHFAVRSGDPAPHPPAIVLWPSNAEEVAAIVRYAADRRLPLVPFGAGSGVCGGISPSPEAIVVDLKAMRAIGEVDEQTLGVRLEAGVIGQHLEDRLNAAGFTMGHYPSSISCSTVGGWIATRSAGQCSGRYGKIEDMVLSLGAVDGRGRLLRGELGGANEALIPLLVGSEGIASIITDATMRVAPLAPRTFAAFRFADVPEGLEAIREIYQRDLRPAVARLYDPFDTFMASRGKSRPKAPPPASSYRFASSRSTRFLVRLLGRPRLLNELVDRMPSRFFGGALLVLIWEAEQRIACAERELAASICRRYGGVDLGESPARQWLVHRHSVSYRQSPIVVGGGFVDTMEVAAPWSRLLPMYERVRKALRPHVFVMAHFSHAYADGASIYFTFAGARRPDTDAAALYDRAWREALGAVEEARGTISHHHGVGRSKAAAMRREQGAALEVVGALAHALDPAAILNPGNLIGDREPLDAHSSSGDERAPARADELERSLEANFPSYDRRTRTLALSIEEEIVLALRLAARSGGRLRTAGGRDREGAVRLDLQKPARPFDLDRRSQILRVHGGVCLDEVEDFARSNGLTLGLRATLAPEVVAMSIGEWIDRGAPGRRPRLFDPVSHSFAGLDAVLPSGRPLHLRAAPRRAVGPDLILAFVGAEGRLGVVTSVTLVLHEHAAAARTPASDLSAHPTADLPRQLASREEVGDLATVSFAFATLSDARSALVGICAQGIRPRDAWVEQWPVGARLHLHFVGALAEVAALVARELAVDRGGSPIDEAISSSEQSGVPSAPSEPLEPERGTSAELLDELARELDPLAILSGGTQ